MALKFLNKKGWHTGSLRNIETVWKAEQKHEGEQKKLEELRKQIQDEREKSEFRLMQEQAGLVPKQERLEFLYDSGLQVGKVAQADEYLLGKPVEEAVQPESDVGQVAAKPGALFVEEKPASANDSWRKLHSDPLFMIRQQEQAAIAKIKSNPVKMAEIKKAAEMKKRLKEEKKKKHKEAKRERREKKKRKKLRSSSTEDSSDSDNPRKDRKHGHESDAEGDAGHKDRRTQVLSRNLSRIPSRSPTTSPVRKDRRESSRKLRSLSRSPARRKDYVQSRSRRDDLDSRGALNSEERHREHNFSDQRLKESDHQDSRPHDTKEQDRRPKSSNNVCADEGRRKQVLSRNRSRSPTRSPTRSLVRRDRRQSPRKLRSLSRSPARRRDYGQNRSRRDDLDSTGALKSEGRHREHNFSDQRLKESDHQDYGKRKRASSRSLSRSPVRRNRSPVRRSRSRVQRSRSPVGRRDYGQNYGQSRSRRDNLDFRSPFKSEERPREHDFTDLRLKESDHQAPRPYDTREQEGRLRYSSNGSADDLRRNDPVVREKNLGDEDEGVGRKETNGPIVGVPSRPMNKGRPPKPGQLSDAERAARLAEMQANANVHEEQRWQRLKRAADADAMEVKRSEKDKSNEEFLADTQKSIFGSERASASTIEKSVKRRAHFIERSSADNEKNAFRR